LGARSVLPLACPAAAPSLMASSGCPAALARLLLLAMLGAPPHTPSAAATATVDEVSCRETCAREPSARALVRGAAAALAPTPLSLVGAGPLPAAVRLLMGALLGMGGVGESRSLPSLLAPTWSCGCRSWVSGGGLVWSRFAGRCLAWPAGCFRLVLAGALVSWVVLGGVLECRPVSLASSGSLMPIGRPGSLQNSYGFE